VLVSTFKSLFVIFKGRNIGLKNKRSHFGLVIRPSVYYLLNGLFSTVLFLSKCRVLSLVATHDLCFFGLPNFSGKIRPNPNFGTELRRISSDMRLIAHYARPIVDYSASYAG
jgi:hypothetical protein